MPSSRSLAIVNGAMQGERLQPSESDLSKLGVKIKSGKTKIEEIFPGIAAIAFATEGTGVNVSLRIVKNEGIPISYVDEGTEGASVIAVRRVHDLDFYTLRHAHLVKKTGASSNTVTAMLEILKMKPNPEYSKKVITTWLYSQKAVAQINEQLHKHPGRAWYSEFRVLKRPALEARKKRLAAELAERVAERAAEAARRNTK